MHRWFITLFAFTMALPLVAAPHEARIPLHEGKIRLADVSEKLLAELHCPVRWCPLPGSIDVRDLEGTRFVDALNHAFGDGCRVNVQDDSLVLHVDRDKLPRDGDAMKAAVRIFTEYAAPENAAAQYRQYGLLLPTSVDLNRPLVILVHGLDCNRWVWQSIWPLLEDEGYQVATFSYPASQAIGDSAKMLAENVAAIREMYPTLKLDVVAHSMGSLVARSYIESPEYHGGIGHFIMLSPPNHGSHWAGAEFVSKGIEHFALWRHNPEWHWTWMITDGLGEASRDLQPKSIFLKRLNEAPRREGVKYTIVAGNQNPAWNFAASVVGTPARWVPGRIANWWGFRQTRHGLEEASASLRGHRSDNDGPVSLKSARLNGVDDFVVLHVEHVALLNADGGQPPAVWKILRDRLAR